MVRRFTRALREGRRAASVPDAPAAARTLSDEERLAVLKWHIDRYDRLRSSTASRAAVVLSAGAILSAGNAVLFGQLLGATKSWLGQWGWLLALTMAVLGSAALVVASLIRAANVLITTRGSREMFRALGDIPVGLVFNSGDTVARLKTFDDFRTAVAGQDHRDMVAAAEVELWVCLHQHRHRYAQLRAAVRLLRHAALAFLAILVLVLTANLAYAL